MAKMKAKKRNDLPDEMFGLPEQRKYPLNDEAHVKAAVRLFGKCPDEDKPRLARNILRRAKELNMDSSGWKVVNAWAQKKDDKKEEDVKQEYVALSEFDHFFVESEAKLPNGMTLRKATKDDIDFIVEMELTTFSEKTKSHYPGIPEYCKRDAKKYLKDTQIIMDNDERIGIYMAYMDNGYWFISSIALLPKYQGRGIGTALLKHDIDEHDKIQLYVDIYNDKAKKLYERLGFKVVNHDDDHWIMELDKNKNVDLTVAYIKDAIKKIHEKTLKDKKPPTGNQNCQICTWCLEAQCRGIDALPRAVYSPRDKGLSIYGPSIVIDPYKIRITDRDDVYNTVRKAGKGARFWVHVNWNQSTGGHEFMLINIDSKTYIADAQAGSLIEFGPKPKDVETLRTTKDYFYEINFAHSYIVRLDNKKLNEKILDEATDESKTLPWDEKKDIEYMRREGLLTGEEDEEYAKKTGLITEAASDMIPDVIDYMIPILKSSEYGIGYKGKLITDPTNADYNEKWHCLSPEEFLEYHGGVCYDYVEWEADYLKKHDIKFKKFHISYHVGFDKNDPGEDASTHSICVAVVDGKYIYIEGSNKKLAKKMNYVKEFDDLNKLLDFAVENMQHDSKQNKLMIIDYTNVKGFIGWNMFGYQGKIFSEGKVIRSDFTQEQFIEEAYRDSHFNKLYFHLSPDSYLDGQVFKPRVPEYLDRYDPEDKNFENDTTPRVCFSPSIEGCLNGIMVNMKRMYPIPKDKLCVYIPEKPFHEYKHKTNKELIRDKDVFDASVTQEVWILEPVRMKLYGVIEIDSVYNVKRKQNVPTASGKKSDRPYYKYKWHWLVKPKVLKKGTKFDYSVPKVIENLCMDLPKFRYGLIKDGRLQTGNVSESDYDKYWVVHSPEEIDRAGGGNCYDMVEWESGYLDAYGVGCNKYYVSMTHNNKLATHTFIVVKDHGKFIYIEAAFKRVVDEIGHSKEFDKLEDIFDYVIECMIEYEHIPKCDYGVWDYTDIKFKVGTPIKNFQDYIITNGENVYEGNKSNKGE